MACPVLFLSLNTMLLRFIHIFVCNYIIHSHCLVVVLYHVNILPFICLFYH